MQLFFDLDGTLLDVAPRHYRVYVEVTTELGGRPLPRDVYWPLKRSKTRWDTLLPMSGLGVELEPRFLERFIHKIEHPEYLAEDLLFPGALATLESLHADGHEMRVVSLRRNADRLEAQLSDLGIEPLIIEALSGHSESDGHDVKVALIERIARGARGVLIGDTEADIVAGNLLGLTTVAVTSGLRDEAFLRSVDPDYVLDDITGVTRVVADLVKEGSAPRRRPTR